MFRFTTLAMLLALAFSTAVLTGCDSGSKGSSPNKAGVAPPSGSENKVEPQTLPKAP